MDCLKLPDFVGCTLHVSHGDGRMLTGTLVALDCQMNLLLDHVQEHRAEDHGQRSLGLVSVPRNTITSIKMGKGKLEKLCHMKQEILRHIV